MRKQFLAGRRRSSPRGLRDLGPGGDADDDEPRTAALNGAAANDAAAADDEDVENDDEDEDEDGLVDAAARDQRKRHALLAARESSMNSGFAWHLAKVDGGAARPSAALEEQKADAARETASPTPEGAADLPSPQQQQQQQQDQDAALEGSSHSKLLSPAAGAALQRGVKGGDVEGDESEGGAEEEKVHPSDAGNATGAPDIDITARSEAVAVSQGDANATNAALEAAEQRREGAASPGHILLHSTSGQFVKVDVAPTAPNPDVIQLPETMWEELVDTATACYRKCLGAAKANGIEIFAELAAMTGCMPLAPRNDPDVAFMQLLKDIKRESVSVNDEVFIGASSFDSLYSALELLLVEYDSSLHGIGLEHKVQRLLRSCSRTVSGFDSFEIVSALFGETEAMVTPAMMDNSPIRVQSDSRTGIVTVSSTNVFKLSQQLHDGGLATAVVLKTEVSEQIELDSWQTVRWMRMKPLDRAEECVNAVTLFRERTLDALLKTQIRSPSPNSAESGPPSAAEDAGPQNASTAAWEHNKRVLDVLTEARSSLDLALAQSIKAIRELAHAEYLRGRQDGLECRTQRMSSDESSIVSSAEISSDRGRPQSPIGMVGHIAQEAAAPIAKFLGAANSGDR